MPHIITRQQAISSIEKEIPEGECIACHLVSKQKKYVLHQGKHTTVILSEYPRCWGQAMVITHRHVTSFTELKPEEWNELSQNTLSAAKAVEQVLKPLRCYIAATGAGENMYSSTPHLHFNITPVYHKTDKPSVIFTWEHGVYAATAEEWTGLYESLKKVWI
jgi:diadenosine tetraphosphate (Ap4A) HIT family hydrolase